MSIMFLVIAGLIIIGVLMTLFTYKLVVKPRIIKSKCVKNKYMFGELKDIYVGEMINRSSKGSLKVSLIILFFCVADLCNYNSIFDNIFQGSSNMIAVSVMAVSLTMIVNYSAEYICEYLYRNRGIEILDGEKKFIKIFIIMSAATIVTLITELFILRFTSMDLTFEDNIPGKTMKSMTTLWSSLALGTTVSSFLYSSINNKVIKPLLQDRLTRKYIVLFEILKSSKEKECTEIKLVLENSSVMTDIERTHMENIKVIKADMDFTRELYKVDKRKALKVLDNKKENRIVDKVIKTEERVG